MCYATLSLKRTHQLLTSSSYKFLYLCVTDKRQHKAEWLLGNRKYRELTLSLDRLARNLFAFTCLLLAAESLLSHPMLPGLSQYNCLFSSLLSLRYVQIQFAVL
jgi:hypothetical protein